MVEFKCDACGATFPNENALRSHVKMKVSDESVHFRKMSAYNQTVPISPDQEKPR